MRQTIDLTLGVTASTKQISGDLKLQFGYVDASETDTRIVYTLAETQLWQLYLGDHYLQYQFQQDMNAITGIPYSSNKNTFQLFLAKYCKNKKKKTRRIFLSSNSDSIGMALTM